MYVLFKQSVSFCGRGDMPGDILGALDGSPMIVGFIGTACVPL